MTWIEATARWYLVLIAVTWAFAPGIRWLCHSLTDRGVTIARPIALLAALYPAWLVASLGVTMFGGMAVTATVVAAAVLGWVISIRRREIDRLWLKHLVLAELGSALLFGFYVWLRGYTPQILGTEKPMDVAFLASSTRTISIPPPDPWFAGEPINYYYLGYLLHGTVGRLSQVSPETGFNLALATLFSMTAVAAFGIVWNAVRPSLGPRIGVVGGLFALFVVTIAGNFYAPQRLLDDLPKTVSAWWWDSASGIGWRSSRIVCDGPRVENLCPSPATETINEFPFFSFLLGDLHPHVMALPYTLVVVSLAWNLALEFQKSRGEFDRSWLMRIALTGPVVGSLYALNAWDFPTYLLLVMAGVWAVGGAIISRTWKPLLLLLCTAILAWLPFFLTYVPPTVVDSSASPSLIERLPFVSKLFSTVGLHLGERTSVAEYLTVFGVQYAFGLALVHMESRRSSSSRQTDTRTLVTASIATLVPGVLLSAPVIPLCGIPLALAIVQLRDSGSTSPRRLALTLFSFAWALSIGVEFVYVRDVFEDRMNTLFKFYYQTWTLYGLAAALTIAILWEVTLKNHHRWQKTVIAVATIASLLAGASYPAIATYQWTDHFNAWRGLDGLAYGEQTNVDDTTAIRWLRDHVAPGDVVLEAGGCSYLPFDRLPFNRVSAFTGVPTVVGWGNNHQRQWRAGQPALLNEIDRRQGDVAEMFSDADSPLLDQYEITWIFVGEYETGDWQSICPSAGPYDTAQFLASENSTWTLAFHSGDTRIYWRVGE